MPFEIIDGVRVEISEANLWRRKLLLNGGLTDQQVLAARDAFIAANDASDAAEGVKKTAFEARLAALDAAIAATDVDLPLPTVANLAQFQAMGVEVNKIRNRQNAILRTLRYIYNHQ